jgi:hypothetical protein
MAEKAEVPVQDLFKLWRSGDADAGQAMARRFNDWYYAVATSRLGDENARLPLEKACAAFVTGIPVITRAPDLVPWAHSVLKKHVHEQPRISGGDFQNGLTGSRKPTDLLREARFHMKESHVEMLCMAYSADVSDEELESGAEATEEGWPMALLSARYALKRILKDTLGVGFSVVPAHPNLDCAPLPLYESDRMATDEEDSLFEQWLITNEELCRDLAEFATFSHALRVGALEAPRSAEVPRSRRGSRSSVFDEIRPRSSAIPRIASAMTIVGVLLVLAVLVYLLFFQGLS